MKNKVLESRLSDEVMDFITSRKTLLLSSLKEDGTPYASYAPFAIGQDCLYLLISEIAVHATNLRANPKASVLIIEDEDSCGEIFARLRVNYSVHAENIAVDSEAWKLGIDTLAARHGSRINNLSQLADFKLFKLQPQGGRYVKDFGRAYTLAGTTLAGEVIDHMRDGHKPRALA